MNDNTVYICFGVVAAIYIAIRVMSRGKSKERKSRKFMDNYKRKDE